MKNFRRAFLSALFVALSAITWSLSANSAAAQYVCGDATVDPCIPPILCPVSLAPCLPPDPCMPGYLHGAIPAPCDCRVAITAIPIYPCIIDPPAAPPAPGDVQNNFGSAGLAGQLSSLANTVTNNINNSFSGGDGSDVNQNGFFLNNSNFVTKSSKGSAPNWNVWAKGDFHNFNADTFDGNQIGFVLGADRFVDNSTLLGALIGYYATDFDTLLAGTAGTLENKGFTVAGYYGRQLANGLIIDAMVGVSQFDYDVSNGGVTGSFDATRVSASLGLAKRFNYAGMVIEPNAKVIYAVENQDAYTDSAAVTNASQKIKLGRISIGPKLHLKSKNENFKPWISLDAEYDFSDVATVATGAPNFDSVFSVRAGAGFSLYVGETGLMKFEATAGGLGSGEYTSVGGSLKYQMKF